ncbi:hypothetical protein MBM_02584 [Drepanopeziza brunnea f. sp. 'multigermtubi' MB_m1]|uniref:Uncharacterized protein n=1 Tax=Marssonina brunnea f. sp. multigermtubi (strain MB_m1) TaxID=1072389 RepID=K1X2U7_MARBU|nr:uncharacterized protein MBM_02584 [Drepanopeziza brunnea f. sp. 'multigermtubi' MB_m1]EKD19347.1 hypothetical protein MBM_02584 [Drepanopeziza brunnea f. sp. 'multigermtubi' MB_m1]
MGLMTYISSLLLASQPTTQFQSSTAQNFTLQVWLNNSPLNQQSVSWFPNPDFEKPGFFGIPIRSPADPLPVGDRAIFVRDRDFPDSLFFAEPDSQINKVFVQASGEVEYAVDLPTEFFKPYTGNFSTVDYTHWPDLETIHVLDFEPPGFVLGVWLACPRDLGVEKGYQLLAMTPMFKHAGCITLDWLVMREIEAERVADPEVAESRPGL